jgi:hypothetical protein
MDIPILLPTDAAELMRWYQINYPRVVAPIHIFKNGYWCGIAGRQTGSFVDYARLRQTLADEKLRQEEREEWLFSGECPGVAYATMDAGGNIIYDNSHWNVQSPPPSRWAPPEKTYDSALFGFLRK